MTRNPVTVGSQDVRADLTLPSRPRARQGRRVALGPARADLVASPVASKHKPRKNQSMGVASTWMTVVSGDVEVANA
jgi:hypothetical protein